MVSVRDLMTKDVATIDISKTVHDAASLMSRRGVSCLVITEEKAPIGMVTERDFVQAVVVNKLPFKTNISEIMKKPLITIDPDSSLREAARLMNRHRIRRLPVFKEGKIVGIITCTDFSRQLGRRTITEDLLETMVRHFPRHEAAENDL